MLATLSSAPVSPATSPPGAAIVDGRAGSSFSQRGIDRPFVCFAPGTSDDLRRAISGLTGQGQLDARNRKFGALAFQDRLPWTITATDFIPFGEQGEPVTLTWSLVPDGVEISGSREPTSPSNLHGWLDGLYNNGVDWLNFFREVFDRWGELTGITFVYVEDDGAPFPDSPGLLGARGDIRISGHPIDGPSNILAYNYYPNRGDMVIDTSDSFFRSHSSRSLRLRNVLAHEIGHGLGLAHVCPANETKLMEPFVSTAYEGPQFDEVFTAQRLYGDRFEANDNDQLAGATDLGTVSLSRATIVHDVSIDGDSDFDFYRFNIEGSRLVSVNVVPVGEVYLEGPQTGDCDGGVPFDPSTRRLRVELLDEDGQTVLSQDIAGSPGLLARIIDAHLPHEGSYYLKIFSDSSSQIQLYGFRISTRLPLSTLSVNAPENLSVTESTTEITVPVSISEMTDEVVLVAWETQAVDATEGEDYLRGRGNLFIPRGAEFADITVQLRPDDLDENDEAFRVVLFNALNASLGDAETLVTIVDDDASPVLTTTLSQTTVQESVGNVTLGFQLSESSGRDVRFDFETKPGSAEADLDYFTTSSLVELAPGNTTVEFEIPIIDDVEAEGPESLTVRVFGLAGTEAASDDVLELEILDNDHSDSFPQSVGVAAVEGSTDLRLTWEAVPGRSYRVEESDDLTEWSTVSGAENLDPTEAEGSFLETRPRSARRKYYRIVDEG